MFCDGRIRPMLLVTGLLLAGCPGRLQDLDAFAADVDCLSYIPQIYMRSCASSGCHTAADREGNLDLESPDLVERLRGQHASGARCSTGVLLDPQNPTDSLMYTKLLPVPPCGDRMPMFARQARPFEMDCMLEWIAAQDF